MINFAVILAAGAGTRFEHDSDFVHKSLLPIEGRSILVKLIEDIHSQLGIKKFLIIVGYESEKIKSHLNIPDLEIEFLTVDYTSGPALGLLAAETKCPERFLTVLGDEIYFHSDFTRMLNGNTVCGLIETNDPRSIKNNYSVELNGTRISMLSEKPETTSNNLMGVGCFTFNHSIFNAIRNTPVSPRSNKVDLIDAVNVLAQHEQVDGAVIGGTYFNINRRSDYESAKRYSETISLIIPTLNEEFSIQDVLEEFKEVVDEIVVVDNQSTDHTVQIARKCGVVVHEVNVGGYGAAIQEGIKKSKGNIVVLMEGDHSFRARNLTSLIENLKSSDMVIGSRTTKLNPPDSPMKGLLRLGNITYGKIIQLFWWKESPSFTDVGCTYRAMWRSAYFKIASKIHSPGPEFIVDLTIEALNSGLKTKEVPIAYFPRKEGESKHSANYFQISRTALKMLRVILSKKFLHG